MQVQDRIVVGLQVAINGSENGVARRKGVRKANSVRESRECRENQPAKQKAMSNRHLFAPKPSKYLELGKCQVDNSTGFGGCQ
jgi:hypothetical protein